MKKQIVLSIRGQQAYMDQEPEVIELVTEGFMEYADGVYTIQYEESDLTGLAGVTTTFCVEPNKVTLTRTGKLNSQMVFQEGVSHTSLYQMEFGALMITVCATRILAMLDSSGGMIDLIYNIDIEQSAAGTVDYRLDIQAKD